MIDVRDRFSRVLQRDEIYLANHSLGRPLDKTAEDVGEALDLWYADMDAAWEAWLAETNRWRANVAKLIGLSRPDAVVPKTSAGQGLRAVLNAFPQDRPVQVIATTGEFDSIDFILKAYQGTGRAVVTWVEPAATDPLPLYSVDSLVDALAQKERRGPAGLVVCSLVFFTTGQILQEVSRLVEAAHDRGWLVLLDVYHAAGVIPLRLEELGVDFAIGGSYKYLRGGPGACWLAFGTAAPALPRTLDTGWFAKKDTFGYDRSEVAEFADGGKGWLESTPPVLMPYQARAGLELTLEIGVAQIRQDSLERQARMRQFFRATRFALLESEDPNTFGAFSLLRHPGPSVIVEMLKRHGINVDARGEYVRFGPDFLNTDDEFERAAYVWKELATR